MVRFVLGKSGSGKTKWLIEEANKDKKSGNGHIVFVDVDDDHIFSLDHEVRLVNMNEFNIKTTDELFGFLSGIISRDFDVEKIYLDGVYNIIPYDEGKYIELFDKLTMISKKFDVNFFIGLNKTKQDLNEFLSNDIIELTV